ncbi:MAG: LytTR family transcriptional regulator [Bacteroidales bacterium]|nr:LytTR family transcriptional regulator [Bacteroidales bacterium]
MFKLTDIIPRYLLGKHQLTASVVFAALFSLIFILVSVPFTQNAWFQLGGNEAFGYTVAFFVMAVMVIVLSKRTLYYRSGSDMTYLEYMLWCFAEVCVIALLYTVFTIEGESFGLIETDNVEFISLLAQSIIITLVCLGIPYVISGLYFALEDKNNTIRLMNYSNVVSDEQVPLHKEKRINLTDNNGAIKFSINSDNLYFLESDDNYIQVWYTDTEGEMKQYMLRCKLKTIEESFVESELVRCHRKFVVNMDKVATLRFESGGYFIDLDRKGLEPIPVSKSYEETILSRFNSR